MRKQKAGKWYIWLWLSPLLTVPTLVVLLVNRIGYRFIERSSWSGSGTAYYDTVQRITILIAVLASALWHLILLIPASDKAHPFVRWHGRQALLLAGIRTALPLAFGLGFGQSSRALLAIPVLLLVWLAGTLWGQQQAARGDCSLMRWFGQGELLSTLREADADIQLKEQDAEALVEIIRFGRDPEERRSTLAELRRRGMVEPL